MKGRAPIDKLRAELRAKFPPDWQERTRMDPKPMDEEELDQIEACAKRGLALGGNAPSAWITAGAALDLVAEVRRLRAAVADTPDMQRICAGDGNEFEERYPCGCRARVDRLVGCRLHPLFSRALPENE